MRREGPEFARISRIQNAISFRQSSAAYLAVQSQKPQLSRALQRQVPPPLIRQISETRGEAS